MSNRAQRRAAERQSQLAAHANPSTSVSEAQLNANRANAQHSTGPRTEEGKAKSSMNAVKTGLTGRTVLLPSDDAVAYQHHLDRNFAEFAPVTDKEKALVQTIADAEWRLLRITPLEAGIYALGRLELAEQFAAFADSANREALIQSKIFLTYRKDFANLALQERRLRNQRQADIAELARLQTERADQEKELAKKRPSAVPRGLDGSAHGFDFSLPELQAFCQENRRPKDATAAPLDFAQWLAAFRARKTEQKAA